MSRQINFFLTPSDLLLLERQIRAGMPMLALEARSEAPQPRLVGNLQVDEMGKTWLKIYLLRPDDLGSVILREVPAQKCWTIDALRSPVLELMRCYFDGKKLRRGRLYCQTGFYQADGAWVDKPHAFLDWADHVFRVTRRALRRDPELDVYFGPEASALRSSAAVELATV